MSKQRKHRHSATVSVLSTLSILIGLVGLAGSLIPYFGMTLFVVSAPALALALPALFVASSRRENLQTPLIAMSISLLGMAISGAQYLFFVFVYIPANQ